MPRTARSTSAKPGRIKRGARRVRRATDTVRAHASLARAVLAGELKECAWEALKALYFGGTTEQACVDAMVRWADRHGIEVEPEKRRISIGNRIAPYYVVKFKARSS